MIPSPPPPPGVIIFTVKSLVVRGLILDFAASGAGHSNYEEFFESGKPKRELLWARIWPMYKNNCSNIRRE